ncbi:hypothetical protein F1D61_27700 [Methylobacterium aquaticum]|nr:hypothetical protein F1D61_27700 [Methylobacterium aquaticum]
MGQPMHTRKAPGGHILQVLAVLTAKIHLAIFVLVLADASLVRQKPLRLHACRQLASLLRAKSTYPFHLTNPGKD